MVCGGGPTQPPLPPFLVPFFFLPKMALFESFESVAHAMVFLFLQKFYWSMLLGSEPGKEREKKRKKNILAESLILTPI